MKVFLGKLSRKEGRTGRAVFIGSESADKVDEMIERTFDFFDSETRVVEIVEVDIATLDREVLVDTLWGTMRSLALDLSDDFRRTAQRPEQLSDSELVSAVSTFVEWLSDQSIRNPFFRAKSPVDRQVDADFDKWVQAEGLLDEEDDELQIRILTELRSELNRKYEAAEANGLAKSGEDDPPQAILNYRQIKGQERLYDRLNRRKVAGLRLDFDRITMDELVQLWCSEAVPDAMIADLYGVAQKTVTKRRHEWDIMQYNCGAHAYRRMLQGK